MSGSSSSSDRCQIDEYTQQDIKEVLKQQQDGIQTMVRLMKEDLADLDVIAEGVESAEVHRFLIEAGCPRFQGYHYSRPMALADFRALLRAPCTELRAIPG